MTFEEIHKKIIEMDELCCKENLLNQLLQFIPTPDEVCFLTLYIRIINKILIFFSRDLID